jgi:hypothetical protein
MSARAHRWLVGLGVAVVLLTIVALPATASAFSPFGPQNLLVVLIERAHTGCPADSTNMPTCPRYTASQWQTILQRDLNSWYSTETYGQTSWNVHVLVDPSTSNGWWPAPHTDAQYTGDNFNSNPSIGRDAGETIPSQALLAGELSIGELATTHRLLMIDNYHRRGGQTNSVGVPLVYNPTFAHLPFGIDLTFPFVTTVSVAAEDSNDADALSVIRHELGHQLGEPDLYSQSPCPLMPAGAPAETMTGDNSDCAGPWDHMGLDYWGFPGFGGYTKQVLQWLNPDPLGPSVQVVPNTFSGSLSLDPVEAPAGGKLILSIPNDVGAVALARLFGVVGPYKGFMVECRRRLGDDTGIPAEGALVSYIDPTRGNDHPQDVARGSSSQTVASAILSSPGDTYANTAFHFTIRYTGVTANDGCGIAVNVSRFVIGHYVPAIDGLSGFHAGVGMFGGAQSFSQFIGQGVMVGGPNRGMATVAAGGRSVKAAPLRRGAPTTIRFTYANAGSARAASGIATVSVTDPYTVSVCGPQPPGRTIARVKLATLQPGQTATAQVRYVPHGPGPIGVTVQIAPTGSSPMQTGGTERGVLGFQSATRGKHGIAKPASTTIVVVASKTCPSPARAYLDPLVLPKGWKITSNGLDKPLQPGETRKVRITVQLPKHSTPQALDLPIAILGAVDNPALQQPAPPPYQFGEPDLVAGFDLLSRLIVPGKPIPSFTIPPAATTAPVAKYPASPPQLPTGTLTLNCPKGGPKGTTVTTTGTLSPVEAGAVVTLTYTPLQGPGGSITHTVSTDENGGFSDSFGPPVGVYSEQATWAGDGVSLATKSNTCQFSIG